MRAKTIGNAGVIIFFAISGYLITAQLVAEKLQTGSVNIPFFLIRRFLRLFPALIAMLGVTVLLDYMGVVRVSTADFIRGVTYTMDYYHPAFAALEHLWSLSVEEQFYLLWPLCFLPAAIRVRSCAAAAVILLWPLVRLLEWHAGIAGWGRPFECVADCLAAGCVLALMDRPKIKPYIGAISLCAIVPCCYLNRLYPAATIATISIEAGCAFLIVNAVLTGEPGHWFLQALTLRPLV